MMSPVTVPFRRNATCRASVHLVENLPLEEVRQGNISQYLAKAIENLCNGITAQNPDSIGEVSLNIQIDFLKRHAQNNTISVQNSSAIAARKVPAKPDNVVISMEDALKMHLAKRESLSQKMSNKLKELRKSETEKVNGEVQTNDEPSEESADEVEVNKKAVKGEINSPAANEALKKSRKRKSGHKSANNSIEGETEKNKKVKQEVQSDAENIQSTNSKGNKNALSPEKTPYGIESAVLKKKIKKNKHAAR